MSIMHALPKLPCNTSCTGVFWMLQASHLQIGKPLLIELEVSVYSRQLDSISFSQTHSAERQGAESFQHTTVIKFLPSTVFSAVPTGVRRKLPLWAAWSATWSDAPGEQIKGTIPLVSTPPQVPIAFPSAAHTKWKILEKKTSKKACLQLV